VGNVDGQHFLQLLKQLGRTGSVAAVAFQFSHDLPLSSNVALSIGQVALSGSQGICSVHGSRYHGQGTWGAVQGQRAVLSGPAREAMEETGRSDGDEGKKRPAAAG
jgi:hypothetical protein